MNEALMRIVVGVAMFFEGSEDDVIDPDVALKQLEWIHWELDRLDPGEREALVAFVHAEAEAADDDPRYRAFLLEFPKAMGLRDEE
jgi:hypothetical protein